MSYDAFDGSESSYVQRPEKRIWELNLDDDSKSGELINWLIGEKNWLKNENKARFDQIKRNVALYKGIQYWSQGFAETSRDNINYAGRTEDKLVVNNVYDLVIQTTSKEIKYKPAVEVLPASDEFGDKTGAKLCKSLNDYIWYKNKFEGEIQNKAVKMKRIMGEVYLAILWDEDFGDEFPESKALKEEFKKGKVLEVTSSDGKKVEVSGPVYMGDVKYKIWSTMDVLLDRKFEYDDCDFIYHCEVMHLSEAKKKYPKYANAITAGGNDFIYDFEKNRMRRLQNEVLLWKFYHKRTAYMPAGREIHFINDIIVQNSELPYSHKNLPCIRLTDIDYPGELHGVSFIENIKGLTNTYNNLTTMAAKNLYVTGHPKWVFPAGSVKKESLGNDITLVEFKGPTPPFLAQQNPSPPELYQFRDSIKADFQAISGSGQVSRGEPPSGIKAAVALQFLAEQESERFNETILKYNEFIRQIPIMTLTVAGDFYKDDEKRVVKIIGKNNEWMTDFFPVKYLKQEYDIRVQNASALPASKAARIQTLMDLSEKYPDKVDPAQVLDMLDVAQSQKFIDIVAVSVKAADAENEQILEQGEKVNDPKDYEDHLMHWTVHARQIREWSFKNKTPEENQQKLIDHITAHEMLMMEYVAKNPAYQQKLDALNGFPMFYVTPPPPPPAPMPQDMGVPSGAMSAGAEAMDQPIQPLPGAPVQEDVPGMQQQMEMGGAEDINQPLPPAMPTGQI